MRKVTREDVIMIKSQFPHFSVDDKAIVLGMSINRT